MLCLQCKTPKREQYYLVKVPLLLVKVGSQSVSPLHIDHEVLHLTQESLLGLLQRGTLGVGSLNLLLSILKALSQLFPFIIITTIMVEELNCSF